MARTTTGRWPLAAVGLLGLLAAAPAAARAQEAGIPGHDVDLAIDVPIIGGALVGSLLVRLVPVDTTSHWDHQLFGALDDRVKGNFSASAAKLADGLLAVTLVTPAAFLIGGELDDAAGDRLLIYGEAASVNILVNSVVKYVVQRPRPYTYNPDPAIERYERDEAKDSRLSFYSGHAAMSFGAAVTGGYLYGTMSDDEDARALIWGFELAAATATANLRVRAGKHFYSDVAIGALIGAGIGFAVPALHADSGAVYSPSGEEYLAMAGGILVGAVGSQLLPLPSDILVPVGGGASVAATVGFTPIVLGQGGGLAAIGSF
jgi:membrane-associated phospholipid phosphatase